MKTYDPDRLTTEQLAGVACVECGGELILTTAREVGMSPGWGAVYSCVDGCGRVMPVAVGTETGDGRRAT